MTQRNGKWRFRVWPLLLLTCVAVVAWRHAGLKQPITSIIAKGASAAERPSASKPSTVVWDKSSKGIKLQYPGDWQSRTNPDYELTLIPVGATNEDRRITMDIPDLPPHLPFMIRMSRVEHDYLDDLKKDHPDLHVDNSADAQITASQARLVQSRWRKGDTTYHDVVLLIIHASAVYILDGQTDDAHLAPTRAAFDTIKASIQWTKH